MEPRFLVIEIESDEIKDFKVVGRYKNVNEAFDCKNVFKEQSPTLSYKVSIILDD